MPFKPGTFNTAKATEEKGLLESIGGILQEPLGTLGDDNVVTKNAKGALGFLNPAKVAPALISGIGGGAAGTAKELLRMIPTTIAGAATGGDTKALDESPFSFALNTDLLRAGAQDAPMAKRLHDQIQQVAPLLTTLTDPIAETGSRLGVEGGAQLTRFQGNGQRSAEELVKGTGMEGRTYGELAREGQLAPALIQDILTVAPAARGLGGGLKAVGAEGAANAVTKAANVAERAPLAPYAVPAKGIYNAIGKGAANTTAFPRLATYAETPGIGAPIRAAESAAQGIGNTWEATRYRAGLLDEQARAMRGRKGELESLQNNPIDTPEARAATTEALRNIDQEVMAEAKAKAIKTLGKKAEPLSAIDNELMGALDQSIKTYGKDSPTGQALLGEKAKITEAALPEGKGLKPVAADGTPWTNETQGSPIYINEKAMDSAIKGMHAKNIDNYAVDVFDAVTGAWKSGVLPLNPAWQVGNIVSNSVTAMTYGGVSPLWYFKNRARIKAQLADASEGGGASLGSGQASEFIKGEAKTAAGQGVRKLTDKMYKLNERIDNEGHMAVYLSELDKAKAKGFVGREAENMANARSLEVMGNFKNMSSAEREMIRRAVPFYTWSKHSTKMSLREAMNNPVKQLRLQAAGNAFQGEAPEGLDFLEGAIGMGGGQFLRIPGGGGQLSLGGVEESPLTNPVAAIGAVNPLITSPLVLAGFNPRAGRTLTTGPSQNVASQAAGWGVNQIPLTKMLADMAERSDRGENVVKGDTRAPLLANSRPIAETKQDLGAIPAPLLKFFTGTMIDEPDVRGAAKRQRLAEKDTKKDIESYEKKSQRGAR